MLIKRMAEKDTVFGRESVRKDGSVQEAGIERQKWR